MFKLVIKNKSKSMPIQAETLKDLLDKVKALAGANGIDKLIIKWGAESILDDLNIVTRPVTKEPINPDAFQECEPIDIKHLYNEKCFNLPMRNMSYFDMKDGRIVICYNESKVYTTWKDIKALPVNIPLEMFENVRGTNKRTAIRQFRRWIADGRPNTDLDEAYRPVLNQNTRPKDVDGGDYENTSGDYD